MAVPRSEVVGRRGNAHKVGPHEEKRRDEHDFDRDRTDDSPFRELRPTNNAHTVNTRTGSEEIGKRQDSDHAEKAKEVEGKRPMGVQHETCQANRVVGLLVADELDPKILHVACGVQIHVLALRHHGRDVDLGNTKGIFRRIKVRCVGIVGELNLEGEVLRRLLPIELEIHVVDLGVQIGELDDVIDFGNLVLLVAGFLQLERIA